MKKLVIFAVFINSLFITVLQAQPCPPPSPIFPTSIYISVDAPTLVWQPISNPDSICAGYVVRIGYQACSGYSNWVVYAPSITDSCVTVSVSDWLYFFDPDPYYQPEPWAVLTWNGVSYGCYSLIKRMTNAIMYPALSYPVNNATDVSLTASFSWSSVTGAASYKLSIFKTPTFLYWLYDTTVTSTSVTLRPGVLSTSKNYWWKVKPYTSTGGQGPYSDPFMFRTTFTGIPAIPQLYSPPNGAVINTLTPTLDWDSISNASTYSVQLASDSNFTTIIYSNTNVTNSFVTVTSGLAYNNTYHWRVKASNSYGSSSWSNIWKFSITPPIPSVPNLVFPTNGMIIGTLTPTLDWDSIPIASRYRVQLASDSGFSTIIFNDTNITNSYVILQNGLNYGTYYYWRVKSVNQAGSSSWSSTWKFMVNAGLLWPPVANINYEIRSSYFIDVNTGWVSCAQYKIFKTTNGGLNWVSQSNTGNPMLFDIFFIDQNTGWSVGNTGWIRKTTNGGTNWNDMQNTNTPFIGVWFTNANTGFVAGENTVFKTTNGGANWIQTFSCNGYVQDVFFHPPPNSNTGYICGNYGTGNSGAINKTTNGGLNWVQLQHPAILTPYQIYFANTSKGWTVIHGGAILYTSNGGANWVSQNSGITNEIISMSFINENTGWACAVGGKIIYTTNSGTNWNQQSTLTSAALFSIKMFPNGTGWALGAGGIVLKTSNGGGLFVGVSQIGNEIPNDFSLSQNYPNPFNPVTRIKFAIPLSRGVSEGRGVLVRLVIYDILGREITTLVNEQLQPGTYEVEWDASNYPSGVYFYKLVVSGAEPLTTSDFSETKKMVLIK